MRFMICIEIKQGTFKNIYLSEFSSLQTDRQTDRQNRRTDRHTDEQTDRRTADRHATRCYLFCSVAAFQM